TDKSPAVPPGDRLYINDGTGRFSLATTMPLADSYRSEGAAWIDFDCDGDVDLYVASYEQPFETTGGQRAVGSPDRAYRNLGGNRFEDVSAMFQPPDNAALCGRGVAAADFNNDGRMDIFVSNYRLQRNFLWVNRSGRFEDTALAQGVAGTDVDGWWGHTIGSAWGDCDNDGDPDLFCANLAHPRYIEFSDISQLLINTGPPDYRFENMTEGSGITFDETHSNPMWADLDNDGDLDLYITSIYENERSYLYLNDGTGRRFTDVTFLSGTRVFNGWGAAVADMDGDGDLDILTGSGSGVRLFRNRGNNNRWLQVHVDAVGARVSVTQNGRTQIRDIRAGSGTTSQDAMTAHFGLGDDETPVTVQVRFPAGDTVQRDGVAINQRITVTQKTVYD
ncbi:MAG TPA: CRTAC1 family protein, partial [bacterium]|nr:CRTAC1 family protein [bacterium]